MSVIDKCFEILARAENIDEAMELIRRMLLEENEGNKQACRQIEVNPLDYLVRNISTKAVPTKEQIEEQGAQEAALNEEEKRLELEFKKLPEPEKKQALENYLEAKKKREEEEEEEEDEMMKGLMQAKKLEHSNSVKLRMKNFQKFIENPQSKGWFNQLNYLGQPVLVDMLGNFKTWPKDVIFAVLDMTLFYRKRWHCG